MKKLMVGAIAVVLLVVIWAATQPSAHTDRLAAGRQDRGTGPSTDAGNKGAAEAAENVADRPGKGVADNAEGEQGPEPDKQTDQTGGTNNRTKQNSEKPANDDQSKPLIPRSKLPGYHAIALLEKWEKEEKKKKYTEEDFARFKEIPHDVQMFEIPDAEKARHEVLDKFTNKKPWSDLSEYNRKVVQGAVDNLLAQVATTRWPTQSEIESKKVAAKDIPTDELRRTWYWIKVKLRDKWIPPDLKKRLIGLKELRDSNDYFIVRYEVDGNKIQIFDWKYLPIVIEPDSLRGQDEDAAEFAQRTAKKFLPINQDIEIESVIDYPKLNLSLGSLKYDISWTEAEGRRTFKKSFRIGWLSNGKAVTFFQGKDGADPITGGFPLRYLGGRNVVSEEEKQLLNQPHKKFQ